MDYNVKDIERIQENFIWQHSHKTLRMNYKNSGLKNVDIFFKFASLQCSWLKWIISWMENHPIIFYRERSRKSFKFHSNLDFKNSILNYFPSYYHKFLKIGNLSFLHHPLSFLVFWISFRGIIGISKSIIMLFSLKSFLKKE